MGSRYQELEEGFSKAGGAAKAGLSMLLPTLLCFAEREDLGVVNEENVGS